jgi:8-oxo-dGTP pyrophosphatase MutT (NUDIX family)
LAIGFGILIRINMLIPVKHSIAMMIFNGDNVLSVRRPDDDDELPGIWGLPAGTLHGKETIEDLIVRIGHQKLGVDLTPVRKGASGRRIRAQYLLEMELWEASMKGTPTGCEWRWAAIQSLEPGAAAGSLCCELALKSKSRVG